MPRYKSVHVKFKEMPDIAKEKQDEIIEFLCPVICYDKTFSIKTTLDGIMFYVPEEKYELRWEGTD